MMAGLQWPRCAAVRLEQQLGTDFRWTVDGRFTFCPVAYELMGAAHGSRGGRRVG